MPIASASSTGPRSTTPMGYIFEPEVLHDIVKGATGQKLDHTIAQIVRELEERYPGHIVPARDRE